MVDDENVTIRFLYSRSTRYCDYSCIVFIYLVVLGVEKSSQVPLCARRCVRRREIGYDSSD